MIRLSPPSCRPDTVSDLPRLIATFSMQPDTDGLSIVIVDPRTGDVDRWLPPDQVRALAGRLLARRDERARAVTHPRCAAVSR